MSPFLLPVPNQLLLTIIGLTISIAATIHVLLYKKDTKAAIGWIGLIWLSPFLGTLVYVLLGINRIKRKARALRRNRTAIQPTTPEGYEPGELVEVLGPDREYLRNLALLGGAITNQRLLTGNRVSPLDNGDQAYPAMIRAIDSAERTITLLTYIFRDDRVGKPMLQALKNAKERGVEVRILIDALGSVHEGHPIVNHLRSVGLNVAMFIPTLRAGWFRYANLRNHRKVLVVDGRIGFTGGMNILDDFIPPEQPTEEVPQGGQAPEDAYNRDLHFEVRGPIVAALQYIFADDWAFATDEVLQGEPWFPEDPAPEGSTLARLIVDGPDNDEDIIGAILLGALAVARASVTIITPYFIPDAPLQAALAIAAMRGVEVNILLPENNNHRIVQWAGMPLLEPLLQAGCHIWMTRPQFDHTKLMIVDDAWVLLGSANWDPRSLVLNFELDMECYDPALASSLAPLVDSRLQYAHPLTLDDLQARPLPIQLRDNLARLFSPYL